MYQEEGRLRSLIVFTLIAVTVATIIAMVAPQLALVAGVSFIGMIYMWYIYRYLQSQRGYQDRYTRTGQSSETMKQIVRLIVLGVAFLITVSVVNNLVEQTVVAILITVIPFAIIVAVTDHYAGRETREYIEMKEKQHYDFVDSLGKGEGKCMSCQRKIAVNEQYCPHCGFEQKEIKPDTNYVARR